MSKELNKKRAHYMSGIIKDEQFVCEYYRHRITYIIKKVRDPKSESRYAGFSAVIKVLKCEQEVMSKNTNGLWIKDDNGHFVYEWRTTNKPLRRKINTINKELRYHTRKTLLTAGLFVGVASHAIDYNSSLIEWPKD